MLNIPSATLKHLQKAPNINIHLTTPITHPKQLDPPHNNNPNNSPIMDKQRLIHPKNAIKIELPYKINSNKNKCK